MRAWVRAFVVVIPVISITPDFGSLRGLAIAAGLTVIVSEALKVYERHYPSLETLP